MQGGRQEEREWRSTTPRGVAVGGFSVEALRRAVWNSHITATKQNHSAGNSSPSRKERRPVGTNGGDSISATTLFTNFKTPHFSASSRSFEDENRRGGKEARTVKPAGSRRVVVVVDIQSSRSHGGRNNETSWRCSPGAVADEEVDAVPVVDDPALDDERAPIITLMEPSVALGVASSADCAAHKRESGRGGTCHKHLNDVTESPITNARVDHTHQHYDGAIRRSKGSKREMSFNSDAAEVPTDALAAQFPLLHAHRQALLRELAQIVAQAPDHLDDVMTTGVNNYTGRGSETYSPCSVKHPERTAVRRRRTSSALSALSDTQRPTGDVDNSHGSDATVQKKQKPQSTRVKRSVVGGNVRAPRGGSSEVRPKVAIYRRLPLPRTPAFSEDARASYEERKSHVLNFSPYATFSGFISNHATPTSAFNTLPPADKSGDRSSRMFLPHSRQLVICGDDDEAIGSEEGAFDGDEDHIQDVRLGRLYDARRNTPDESAARILLRTEVMTILNTLRLTTLELVRSYLACVGKAHRGGPRDPYGQDIARRWPDDVHRIVAGSPAVLSVVGFPLLGNLFLSPTYRLSSPSQCIHDDAEAPLSDHRHGAQSGSELRMIGELQALKKARVDKSV